MMTNKRVTEIKYAEVTVDEALRKYLKPLTKEELAGLHEKLDKYGVLLPLLAARIGEQVVLLDGHNRQKWYDDRGRLSGFPAPKVSLLEDVRSILDARVVMLELQLARRNQSEHRVRLERGRLLQLRVQQEMERGSDVASTRKLSSDIADEEGVTSRTIIRNKALVDAIDKIREVSPTVADKIEADALPLSAKEIGLIAKGDTVTHCENLLDGRSWDDTGEPLVRKTASEKKKASTAEKKLQRLTQRFRTCIETLIPALRTELIEIDRGLNISGKSKHHWPDVWDDSLE